MAGIDRDYVFKLSLEEEQRRKLLLQSLGRVNAQRQAAVEAVTEDEEQANEVGSGLLDLSYYADSLNTTESDDVQERVRRAISRAQGAGDELTATGDALFRTLAASLASFDPTKER